MNIEMHEHLIKNLKLESQTPEASSNIKHPLKCLLCNNIFHATPKSKTANYKKYGIQGCPECTSANRYAGTIAVNIKRLESMGFKLHEPFKTIKHKLLISNTTCCNRPWKAKIENVLNGASICRPCNDDKKRKRFESIIQERFHQICANQEGWHDYRRLVRSLTYRNYNSNKETINPLNLPRKRGGEHGGYHLDHVVSIAYCWKHKIPAEICADPKNLRLIESLTNIKKSSKPIGAVPSIFNDYLPFKYKINQFADYLEDKLKIKFEKNFEIDDQLFQLKYNNTLIDILLNEDYKFSILMSRYHLLNVKKLCTEIGYNYIPVFEYEFDQKPELIAKKLSHILKVNKSKKIYARNCTVQEIDSKTSNRFMERFHIQGKCNSPIRLGCFHGEDLVAVMTFSNNRMLFNKNNKSKYELVRYATDSDYICVGVASKLLNYFKKNFIYSSIYSYADKRWSDGNLYKTLKFNIESESDPGYMYFKNGEVHYRYKFAKHKQKDLLQKFNPSKTEYENMLDNGFDKLYDCGNYKFVMEL